MEICYFNNIELCFLPAHTSHGLQPLDNGPFNALKSAYSKHLSDHVAATNAAPVDRASFILCYAKAREAAFTVRNIKAGFRTTGNWPISRRKAKDHPECKKEPGTVPVVKEEEREGKQLGAAFQSPSVGVRFAQHALHATPGTRLLCRDIRKELNRYQVRELMYKKELEAAQGEVEQLRTKRRRRIPNPNQKFLSLKAMKELDPPGASDPVEDNLEGVARLMDEETHTEPDGANRPQEEIVSERRRTRSGKAY